MAKKSKRSRNGSPKSKKNRSPQGALGQGPVSQGQANALARDVRDSSAPEATSGEQLRGEQKRAPESERRRRAAGAILPPPREAAPSDPASDEISIPPITTPAFGDSSASHGLDPNELEDSFFVRRAAIEANAHQAHQDEVDQQVDPRTAQKRTAAAQARRAHLTGYVKWTVVAAAALLAIGIGRVELRGKPEFGPPPPIIHTAMAAVAVDNTPHNIAPRDPSAPPVEESQAAADQAVAALENQAAQPAANDAVQAAPAPVAVDPNAQKPADPAAQPAAATPAATPEVQAAAAQANAPAAAPVASDKTAAQEKKSASQLLEHGNAKGAIEAGERSVALDATDGEAWLVLGAAYQEVGKNADAKRCFNSCVKEGKRGPISECRAMLQ
jgi:hypothetical protein